MFILRMVIEAAEPGTAVSWGASAPFPDPATNTIAISCGRQFDFGLSLLTDGTVRAWGRGDGGQTIVPAGLSNVVQVAGGWNYALALKSNGHVVFWGTYWYGPFLIPANLTNIVAIAAGWSHSLALREDGTIIGWGWNANGQATVPTSLSNVVAIAAGERHSLALKSDGTVAAWGANDQNQATVPTGLSTVAAIAAGATHCMALLSNGTVVAWGEGTHGQTTPPPGLSNAVAIAAGSFHSMALKADGTVANFGSEPDLPGLSNVTSIAAGLFSSYAVTLNPVFRWHGQPTSTNLPAGGDLFLSASALSLQPVRWQWQFNGINIAGATNDTFRITNAQMHHQGAYRALAQNSRGVTASGAASVVVLPSAPWIIEQPEDTLALQGGTVSFHARAGGTEPIVYQWLKDDVMIPDATNATLVLSPIAAAQDGFYRVLASNALGSTVSGPVLLAVEPLVIVTPPASQVAVAGQDLAFQVRAAGERPFEFQWRFQSVDLPGETNATLALQNVQSADVGLYDVKVRNVSGEVLSAPASLTMQTQSPVVVTPPLGLVRREGELALLLTQVRGTEPIHYHWRFDGQPLPGATNHNLVLHRLQTNQAGVYQLWASNIVGITTSPPTTITVRPAGPAVPVAWGNNAFGQKSIPAGLTSVVQVSAAPRHTVALKSDGGLTVFGSLDAYPAGYPPAPPGLTNIAAIAAASYFTACLHSNSTVSAWLPAFQERPESFYAATGVVDVVAIAASSEHAILLQRNGDVFRWSMQSAYSPPQRTGLSNVVAIAQSAGYSLALRSDGTVVEWSGDGFATNEIRPVLLATNVVAIAAGAAHGLGLRTDGKVIAWGFDAWGQTTIPENLSNVVALATQDLASLAVEENGRVVVWGGVFDESVPPTLSQVHAVTGNNRHFVALTPAPHIATMPISQTVLIGNHVTLLVGAVGSTPLRYQWQHNGADLAGATNTSITIDNVQLADGGTYTVTVFNSYGFSVTSAPAELFIYPFNVPAVSFQGATWGDFDNDGIQDLLPEGGDVDQPAQLFRNNGNGILERSPFAFSERSARSAWADFDNDGWLEPLTANFTAGVRVWRNQRDGTFTNVNSSLLADSGYWISTQDFNRDGRMDVAMGSRLYRNEGNGQFAAVPLNLGATENTSAAWGDFDRDSWPDFLVSGLINGTNGVRLLRNVSGVTFTDVSAGLPNIYQGAVSFGDFDNDGWPDVLLAGAQPGNGQPRTYLCRNERNGTFTIMSVALPNVMLGTAAVADFDNDGHQDLFLAGNTGSMWTNGIFRNTGDWSFARVPVVLPASARAGAWGYYDNDGRLDLAHGGVDSGIFRNRSPLGNTSPAAPTALHVKPGLNQLLFMWEPGSDAQTPTPALTYDVRVQTSDGLFHMVRPTSLANGSRQLPAPGNAGARTTFVLTNVSFGRYAWSVQTVDGAFAGSEFAPVQFVNYAAVTLPANQQSGSGVTLNGRMDTNRAPSGAGFEYGLTTSYGQFLPVSTINSAVSARLTGLARGATYHFRLVVTNADGVATGENESFHAPDVPGIAELSFQVLGPSSASLQLRATPNGLPSVAYFEYGLTTNYGARTLPINLGAAPPTNFVTQFVTNLVGGTLHHFRAVLSNEFGIAVSADHTFTTTAEPEPFTLAASDVSSVSVVFNGIFRANTLATRVWYEYGQTTDYGEATTPEEIGSGTNFVQAPAFVSGLARKTVWHYRAIASNAVATRYGADVTFTTLSDVITDPATNIGMSEVRLLGRINPEGLPTSYWFEYGETTQYGSSTPVLSLPPENAYFPVAFLLNGLTKRTTYQYRLVAGKPAETNFGGNRAFATLDDVVTLPPAPVTPLAATLKGLVHPGGQPGVYWFQYGRIGGPTLVTPTNSFSSGDAMVPASHSVTGLTALATHFTRLWVSNAAGLRFGDVVQFTTPWLFAAASTALPVPAHTTGALVPADFDNDDWPDLLSAGGSETRIHLNVGGAFAAAAILLPGVNPATADVADFDNDGWLDFVVAGHSGGTNVARVYRNIGGTNFTVMADDFTSISNGIVRCADYDSDGRSDILIMGQRSGTQTLIRLYKNLGEGQFIDAKASLPATLGYSAAAAWNDFNRDGYPDLALFGRSNPSSSSASCQVYWGDGRGRFFFAASFSISITTGAIGWGDFDNDGYPDLIISGLSSFGSVARMSLFRNNNGMSFDNVTGTLPQFAGDTVSWGDYDSDGWLDILVQGQRNIPTGIPTSSFSAVLRNRGDGTFEANRFPLPEIWSSSGGWVDINRDGRLDVIMSGGSRTGLVSMVYFNSLAASNSPPLLASDLQTVVSNHTARLSWQPASDGQTPSPGLTYALRLRKLPEPIVVSPGASTNGTRQLIQPGGKGQALSIPVTSLMPGRYAWSVHAVDTAFAGGPFAEEKEFQIVAPIFTELKLLPDGRQQLQFLGLPPLSYQLETSTNLTLWTPGPILGPLIDDVFDTIQPASSSPNLYFRLRLP